MSRVATNGFLLKLFVLTYVALFLPFWFPAQLTVKASTASTLTLPAAKLIETPNAPLLRESSVKEVAQWQIGLSPDMLQWFGLLDTNQSPAPNSPPGITQYITQQYLTQTLAQPALVLQGRSPFFLSGSSTTYQIELTVNNPSQNQVIIIPDASGEISLLGQSISGNEIVDRSIDLLSKTTGHYLQNLLAGNGITLSGTIERAATPVLSLGDLTADWVQSAAYDIVLNNPQSKLKLLGQDGQHYASLAVGNLTSDISYTLTGAAGAIVTSANYDALLTGFLQGSNNLNELSDLLAARSNLGLGSVATQAAETVLQVANNLAELPDAALARGNLGLGNIATKSVADFLQTNNNLSELLNAAVARTNLGLGSVATQNANNINLSGGQINGVSLGSSNPAAAVFTALNSSGNTTLASAGNLTLGHSGSSIDLEGNTSVAAGKTLSVASADSLLVGGNIVPQTVTIVVPLRILTLIPWTDQTIFVANAKYQLLSCQCTNSSLSSISGNIRLTVDNPGANPGDGTNLLASALQLSGSSPAVQTATIASPAITCQAITINSGQKVSLEISGLLGIVGNCTITLKRIP